MAKRKSKKSPLISLLILILVILSAVFGGNELTTTKNTDFTDESSVYVHFIDVGQGSSTLIQQGTTGILIDAGEKDYGDTVIDYLNSVGITSLEYVVASHPHSDHIGGLDDVLYAFPTDKIILPELAEFNTPTTRVYEDLLEAIYDNGIVTELIYDEGYHHKFNDDITLRAIAPVKQDDNLNNMSIICYIEAFDTKFAILADAEKDELRGINDETIYDLSADVVALGHHGSSTSLYKPFLWNVNASVAVISCGRNNSYGHPHKETLDFIHSCPMILYRTDECGDIVFKVTADDYSIVS